MAPLRLYAIPHNFTYNVSFQVIKFIDATSGFPGNVNDNVYVYWSYDGTTRLGMGSVEFLTNDGGQASEIVHDPPGFNYHSPPANTPTLNGMNALHWEFSRTCIGSRPPEHDKICQQTTTGYLSGVSLRIPNNGVYIWPSHGHTATMSGTYHPLPDWVSFLGWMRVWCECALSCALWCKRVVLQRVMLASS